MEVADFGCGTGVLVLELARRFPNSRFHGSDISQEGIAIAERQLASTGLTNVMFSRHDLLDLPAHLHGKFDWALTYDVVHDLSEPVKVGWGGGVGRVCLYARARARACVYVGACVCVCVSEREREREREGERESENVWV